MAMGGTMISKAKVRESSVSAVVTRANGRVENFGVVSYYSRNPLKRWAVNAWIKMKELRR